MNKQKILLYIVIAILMTSCYATIQSRKATDFSYQFKKFYVIIKVADNTGNFAPKFSDSFKEFLTQKGVDVHFETLDPLSLESEQDLISRINESNADGLMIISQTQSTTYYNPNTFYFGQQKASGGTFDIKIFVSEKENPVWRGNLKSNTSGYGNLGAVAKMTAEKLYQKLIEDRLI